MEVLNLGSKALRRYDSSTFWDKWYATQKDVPLEWSSQLNDDVMRRVKSIFERIPQSQDGQPLHICELGCGSSNFSWLLKEEGYEVTGVDFSQEVINANRERYPTIRWECADALSLSNHFGPGTFDCIIGKTLLDCFMTRRDASKSIRQLLEQIHVVLKETGRLVFLDRTSAYHFIGRGNAEVLRVGKRGMHLHILKPVTAKRAQEEEVEEEEVRALVERSASVSSTPKHGSAPTSPTAAGAQSGPSSPSKAAVASQRRSSSQTDHLRRLHRARLMQTSSGSLPSLKPKDKKVAEQMADLRISEHVDAAAGLFV